MIRALPLLVVSTLCIVPQIGIAATELIPFVGCRIYSGFEGEISAPKSHKLSYPVGSREARSLSFYGIRAADAEKDNVPQIGLLAPRGWHCFYSYGTGGSKLTVAEEDMVAHFDRPISYLSNRTNAPAITITSWSGETSGRVNVARYLSRFFPSLDPAFVQGVIERGISAHEREDFDRGPFKDDTLHYRNDHIVEFITPPNKKGLGTEGMAPSSEKIFGVAGLTKGNDFVIISVRIPKDLFFLKRAILSSAEKFSGLN